MASIPQPRDNAVLFFSKATRQTLNCVIRPNDPIIRLQLSIPVLLNESMSDKKIHVEYQHSAVLPTSVLTN